MPCLFISRVNARKRNVCHAPLISNYFSTSKCLLASTHDVVLERYHNVTFACELESYYKAILKESRSLANWKRRNNTLLVIMAQIMNQVRNLWVPKYPCFLCPVMIHTLCYLVPLYVLEKSPALSAQPFIILAP